MHVMLEVKEKELLDRANKLRLQKKKSRMDKKKKPTAADASPLASQDDTSGTVVCTVLCMYASR